MGFLKDHKNYFEHPSLYEMEGLLTHLLTQFQFVYYFLIYFLF